MSWVSIGRWRCSVLPSRCCLPMWLAIRGRPSLPRSMFQRMLSPMPWVTVVLPSPISISISTCGRWTRQIVGCWIGCSMAKSKGEPCGGFSLCLFVCFLLGWSSSLVAGYLCLFLVSLLIPRLPHFGEQLSLCLACDLGGGS